MLELIESSPFPFTNRVRNRSCKICDRPFSVTRLTKIKTAAERGCLTCCLVFCGIQAIDEGPVDFILVNHPSADYFGFDRFGEDYKDAEPERLWRHRRLELFNLPGSPACRSPYIRVRPDLTESREVRYSSVISGWLETCIRDHQCGSPEGPLPTRVLDLGLSPASPIRLYHSHRENARYIALSHCWGDRTLARVCTTTATLSERRREIGLDELPLSYKDAIRVARDLGVQYLWYVCTYATVASKTTDDPQD